MKYLLDFDDVLFNTKEFKEELARLGISEAERTPAVLEQIHQENPSLIPSLLHEDARAFLKEYAADCFIVSSAKSENSENNTDTRAEQIFQLRKIELALGPELLQSITAGRIRVVGGDSKREELRLLQQECEAMGEACVFIDDKEEHLTDAHELGLPVVWMNRTGRELYTRGKGAPEEAKELLLFESVSDFTGLEEETSELVRSHYARAAQ